MSIDPENPPLLDGSETRLPDLCRHPEYGVCVAERSRHRQSPLSWTHVAWRSPRLPDKPRARSLLKPMQLARIGGLVDHLHLHGSNLVEQGGFEGPGLPRLRPGEANHLHQRSLVREWTGVIPTPARYSDRYGPTCILRVQQRLGAMTYSLSNSMRTVDHFVQIDALGLEECDGPSKALSHLTRLYGEATGLSPSSDREVEDEGEVLAGIVISALAARMPFQGSWSISGSVRPPSSPLRDAFTVCIDHDVNKALHLAITPSFDEEIRSMQSVDVEHSCIDMDDKGFWLMLGAAPRIQPRRIHAPSPMDILRVLERHGGTSPVLMDRDPNAPAHPTNQWLVPIRDARLFGLKGADSTGSGIG